MQAVILAVHLIVALALVGVILVQRSEGGGLGIGGGGMGNFMTVRGTANLLTRATAILATVFMITSITLTILGGGHTRQQRSILDEMNTTAPVSAPAPVAPPVEGQAPAPTTAAPAASAPTTPAPAAPVPPTAP